MVHLGRYIGGGRWWWWVDDTLSLCCFEVRVHFVQSFSSLETVKGEGCQRLRFEMGNNRHDGCQDTNP